MVKAPCRSMKSDKGVQIKKNSTRTSQQLMEKSAVCYEAWAARNVMNGIKHTREAALVSGVSELILFLCNPPAPLSSDPQLEATRSIFYSNVQNVNMKKCLVWGAEASLGRGVTLEAW